MNLNRRIRYLFYRWLPKKGKVQDSWVHRVLGNRVLARELWLPDIHKVALGWGLGIFISFTPTFPFQMLLALIACSYFRANIPVAIFACWLTNPFTTPFIFLLQYKLGKFVLEAFNFSNLTHLAPVADKLPDLANQGNQYLEHTINGAKYILVGSVLSALILAPLAYISVYVFAAILRKISPHKKRPSTH